MGRKRTNQLLSEEQIREVLQNYDMECEKVMARLERSAQRRLEAAKTQMEARIQKIPPDVRHIPCLLYTSPSPRDS